MSNELKGKKIAFLLTDGFEQSEFSKPWDAVKDAGANVELVSLELGQIQGMKMSDKGDMFNVDKVISDVSAFDYDGLVLPGGLKNPDTLRMNQTAISFVKDFFAQKKPVAAICHGPWVLIEADSVKGRTLTSWPSLKTDIKNAGGQWLDQEVVVDSGLITSRNPDDLPAFCSKIIEEFAAAKQQKQAA